MRILHATNSLARSGGGVAPAVWSLAQGQREAGETVTLYALAAPSDATDWPPWRHPGLIVKTYPPSGPRKLGWSWNLHSAMLDPGGGGQGDILHQHGIWSLLSYSVCRWRASWKRPTVVAPHGMLDEWALQFRAWKKRIFAAMLERANLNRAACLHALCAEEAASMRRYGLRNPIAVVPNGIRLSDYDNLPAPGGMEKRFPGLAGRRRLLFLSRVHPKKGLPHLLRAWSRVGAEFPDWILVIVGPDQEGHTDELKGLVRERGLESAVAFVGPVYGRAKQEALADAHGFVLPSFSEGFGIAVLEAMASRLPVLVTPACHFPDVEIDGAGFIRNPDPDDLAEGLRSLMAMTDSDRREMGERGRKCAETRFSATAVSARMLEVYRWLAGESARPDCVRED